MKYWCFDATQQLRCPRHQWTPPQYHHADPQFWTSPGAKLHMRLQESVFLVVVTRSMAQRERGHKMSRFCQYWTNMSKRWKIRADRNSGLCVYACVCTCINTSYDKHYGTPSLKIAAEQKQRLLWWYALNDSREACNIREEHGHLPIRGITGCTFHTVLSSTVLAIASHLLRSVPMKTSSNHTPSTSARSLANLDCANKKLRRLCSCVCPSAFLSETSILASASFRIINWTTGLGGTAVKILNCGGGVGSVQIWLPRNLRKAAIVCFPISFWVNIAAMASLPVFSLYLFVT